MMRRPAAVLLTTVVPAAFALFAFAHPATLFAESGPVPPACSVAEFDRCVGNVDNGACVREGVVGVCRPLFCYPAPDAEVVQELACFRTLECNSPERTEACLGRAEGASCGTAQVCRSQGCTAALEDGKRPEVLVCAAIMCTKAELDLPKCVRDVTDCGAGNECREMLCVEHDYGYGRLGPQDRCQPKAASDAGAEAGSDAGANVPSPPEVASSCASGGEPGAGAGGAVGLAAVFTAAFGLAWTRRSRRRG